MMRARLFLPLFLSAATVLGCASSPRSPIIVPPEAVREWAYTPDGQTSSSRYVIRMTDGKREWEVEFPDATMGSEVRVPLRPGGFQMRYGGDREGLTAADREMQEGERGARTKTSDLALSPDDAPPQKKSAPTFEGPPAPAGMGEKHPSRKSSYLVGVAQVRQLYESRNFEVALIHLVDLEKDYPNDPKLLAMKGSIYKKLGKPRLARTTWERALVLNPDDSVVAGALRQLAEEEERANDKTAKPNETDDN